MPREVSLWLKIYLRFLTSKIYKWHLTNDAIKSSLVLNIVYRYFKYMKSNILIGVVDFISHFQIYNVAQFEVQSA